MRLLNADNLAEILATSRTECGKSQKFMAQALGKSPGTIKNWENGYAIPNILDCVDWFNALGLNPMRYFLDFLYPAQYKQLNTQDNKQVEQCLRNYIECIAPPSEKTKIAYCVFGNTGSSWSAQVDLMAALNHLPLMTRVHAAQLILDAYEMAEQRGDLIKTDQIMPDIPNLKHAINEAKSAVSTKKQGYTNNM